MKFFSLSRITRHCPTQLFLNHIDLVSSTGALPVCACCKEMSEVTTTSQNIHGKILIFPQLWVSSSTEAAFIYRDNSSQLVMYLKLLSVCTAQQANHLRGTWAALSNWQVILVMLKTYTFTCFWRSRGFHSSQEKVLYISSKKDHWTGPFVPGNIRFCLFGFSFCLLLIPQ